MISILFAATYPERVRALALYNSTARGMIAPDYPFGMTRESFEGTVGKLEEHWGDGSYVQFLAPEDAHDERVRSWLGRAHRLAASPGQALTVLEMVFRLDERHALPAIQSPTLVVHREGAPIFTVEHGRYLAEHIEGTVYRELPGAGHIYWATGVAQALLERWRSSSPAPLLLAHRIASWPRCCSPTSWIRRPGPPSLATGSGRSRSAGPTRSCAGRSAATEDARSTRPATGSSRPSTVRLERSDAPWRFATASGK
ncbi:MAG: alpha/beta fold hydrolase [Actinomycetota bacterium]